MDDVWRVLDELELRLSAEELTAALGGWTGAEVSHVTHKTMQDAGGG